MQRSIDGHPVELDILGEGLPVLMLHGFPLDRRALLRAVDPVFEKRGGYRRIHVDLPGFGSSPRVPSIDSSAAMVEFVLRLIDVVVGDGPILLVGESWGAHLARAVIARRPLGVAGAALLVPMTVVPYADRDVPPHRLLYEEPGVLDGAPDAHAAAIRGIGAVIDAPAWSYFSSVRRRGLGQAAFDEVDDRVVEGVDERRALGPAHGRGLRVRRMFRIHVRVRRQLHGVADRRPKGPQRRERPLPLLGRSGPRASQPIPPPRVIPAAPTEPVSPNGTARPWALAARVNSPATTPDSTQAVRETGSISMPFIADRSITSTPSPVL